MRTVFVMLLDQLDADGATFRHHEHGAVFTMPRADWETHGRPGELRVGAETDPAEAVRIW